MEKIEQDSIRALAGTVDETVTLSQTLYKAVMDTIPVKETLLIAEHSVDTRMALKPAPVPEFDDEITKT